MVFMDRLWAAFFPSSDDPLRRRIGVMGALMGGTTLALLLIGILVEGMQTGSGLSPTALVRRGGIGVLVAGALAALSMGPFVVGGYVSRRTSRPRLLFSACLVLFFVGFALRAFLFFNHVQSRMRGGEGADGIVLALVGEPLASTFVVALLGILVRT